ncbi:MAG: hypothetical protein EON93_00815 [Burkholderiales bacterium]|nr:MAG: hypothetical protein EON93_00815 [Burkholderiales bacterium]
MPRLSTLSNPTGLLDIEKSRITIAVDEAGKALAFSLARLDISNLSVSPSLKVIVIARRGNSEERVELGPLSGWDRSFRQLTELGADGTWSFRVLLVQPGSAKLVAAAENVRPGDQSESASFIGLEPAELDQRPWEIEIVELEGRAVIRFNKKIYQSVGEADADKFFISMILPEAIRRLSEWIARNASALEDPVWVPFKDWLALHGITKDPDADSAEEQTNWCNEVVDAFCDRFEFASQLRDLRSKGTDE